MHENYPDIRERIAEEPQWYDENGCPRYGKFTHERCPNIYATTVVLMEIACQDCGERFRVQMSHWVLDSNHLPPKQWHYGDPPRHNCIGAGESMNCEDLTVLEVWMRGDDFDWKRMPEFEGTIDE